MKIWYGGIWYKGTVIATEEDSSSAEDNLSLNRPDSNRYNENVDDCFSSDDEVPLKHFKDSAANVHASIRSSRTQSSASPVYDSDKDLPFGQCEVRQCKEGVFSTCHRCSIPLFWIQFNQDITSCIEHTVNIPHVPNC